MPEEGVASQLGVNARIGMVDNQMKHHYRVASMTVLTKVYGRIGGGIVGVAMPSIGVAGRDNLDIGGGIKYS